MKAVLLIGGTDSSGGAGLARDIATVTELGLHPLCALTAVTAQSDRALHQSAHLPAPLVRAQIEAACATRPPAAIKIGMLGEAAIVRAVAEASVSWGGAPVVLDPVLRSSSGGELLDAGGLEVLRRELLPRLALLTPNLAEAAALLGCAPASGVAEMTRQAVALGALGAPAVLLKGGHLGGLQAIDVLWRAGAHAVPLLAPRLAGEWRGTGCTLASAIAVQLAQGVELSLACQHAKHYLTQRLQRRD
ncbi:MAG: hydroxymethylpyrimidine/phosphomethylpyrimidine kinase [Gammaproteobacteria bacterium]|nr:hydroxymethylpyrimidine/phosphomethylpyrimidine kinase [Gammaproteobacteria bacterium]